MFPLLPALLLLILQGPAKVERMACDGRLPGALEALHRQISAPSSGIRAADESVLASLVGLSGDHALSCALMHLFALAGPEPAPVESGRVIEEVAPILSAPPPSGRLQDGFDDCRRTRDGPRPFRF